MKRMMSMLLVAFLAAGTVAVYAGEGCSKCKKGDKDKTEKTADDTSTAGESA